MLPRKLDDGLIPGAASRAAATRLLRAPRALEPHAYAGGFGQPEAVPYWEDWVPLYGREVSGAPVAAFATPTAQHLLLEPGAVTTVELVATAGTTPAALLERVQELLPSELTAVGRAQLAADLDAQAAQAPPAPTCWSPSPPSDQTRQCTIYRNTGATRSLAPLAFTIAVAADLGVDARQADGRPLDQRVSVRIVFSWVHHANRRARLGNFSSPSGDSLL